MFAYVSGVSPLWGPRALLLCLALAIAPALSGCSSSKAVSQQALNGPSSNGPAVMSWRFFDDSVPPEPRPVAAKADLEDDGLAAQTPPPKSIRFQADDPTQPWSRNYGRAVMIGANPAAQGTDAEKVPSQDAE